CGDSIVLHPSPYHDHDALVLEQGAHLIMDRSGTPTRLTPAPDGGFSGPTRLVLAAGAVLRADGKSSLELLVRSELHLMPASKLLIVRKPGLLSGGHARLLAHAQAELPGKAKTLWKLRRKGRIVAVQ